MTTDRYMVIRDPLKCVIGWYRRHNVLVNIVIWVVSITFVTLHYHLYAIEFSQNVSLKYEETIFSVVVLPASVAFCCCYVSIVRTLKRKGREILRASRNKAYMGYAFEREKRVTEFAGTVVLFFIACWLPLAILGIVKATGYRVGDFVADFIFSLAIYNLTENAMIYFLFKENIWQKIKKLVVQVLSLSSQVVDQWTRKEGGISFNDSSVSHSFNTYRVKSISNFRYKK